MVKTTETVKSKTEESKDKINHILKEGSQHSDEEILVIHKVLSNIVYLHINL